jgi:conserved oligomeric Golgi complex subunit 6
VRIQLVSISLYHLPVLSSEALTFLSQTRQSTLLSSFIDALTRGGPSGLPRPIELHAHDPMRYAGDMLAWVHQVIAAEREFLESLFGVKGDGRMVGSIRTFRVSEEEEWIRELMDNAVGKLCVPLKVRTLAQLSGHVIDVLVSRSACNRR